MDLSSENTEYFLIYKFSMIRLLSRGRDLYSPPIPSICEMTPPPRKPESTTPNPTRSQGERGKVPKALFVSGKFSKK